jgi:hypothetical protein
MMLEVFTVVHILWRVFQVHHVKKIDSIPKCTERRIALILEMDKVEPLKLREALSFWLGATPKILCNKRIKCSSCGLLCCDAMGVVLGYQHGPLKYWYPITTTQNLTWTFTAMKITSLTCIKCCLYLINAANYFTLLSRIADIHVICQYDILIFK